jgi:hypothetical protein
MIVNHLLTISSHCALDSSLLVVISDAQQSTDDWILTVDSSVVLPSSYAAMTFLLYIVTDFSFVTGGSEMSMTAGSQFCGSEHYVQSFVGN